jgi:hypothetical protein
MDSFGTNITDNLSGLLGKQYPHKKLSRFSTEMRYGNFSLWLDGAFFFSNSIYYGTLCGRPYDLELCMGLQFMRQCPAHAHVKESKNSTGNGVID